jgi:vitamin B12 transporter
VNCFQNSASQDVEGRTGVSLRDVVSGASERLIYGADFSRGSVSVNDGSGNYSSDALAQSAAYAQETWTSAQSEFYAGLRGERDGSLGGEFSPSLGERIALSSALSFKINAATAFRAPDASELYYPNYGNPNLHAERAVVGDATLSDSNLLGGASLGWFDNYTRDLIVTECVQYCDIATDGPTQYPVYAPENVDHARLEGFTFDAQTQPLNGIRATIRATDLYTAQDLDEQTRLPDDAVFTVNLGLQWTGSARSFVDAAGISERAVGARGPVDFSQPLFYQPAAYSNLDAYVRLRVLPTTLLSIRGSNLGNERYAEVAGYPMPGRAIFFELTSASAATSR